ncbi:recombinase zinc beta ribbon domain-containing protein [Amycolatopsis magusensis]|uniref:recombinase zinc beta ribbon domain-containing protein n=1 Tax=Amycolatopsis magusensis TaxID=882444 RepID=UPI0034D6F9C1
MVCGVCGRRMDAHWVRGRTGYRCRHGRGGGTRRPKDPVPYISVREDHLLELLPGLLAT